jgi:S1-C subfamily serine protease
MYMHEPPCQQTSQRRRTGSSLAVAAVALLVLAGVVVVLALRQRTALVSPPAPIATPAASGQQRSAIYSTTIYDNTAPVHAAPVQGVVVDQQLRVVAVVAGSAADQAGLQPGDIITQVNDAAIASAAAGKQRIRQAPAGQEITLTVERNGQTLVLSVWLAGPHGQPGQATPTPVPSSLDYF